MTITLSRLQLTPEGKDYKEIYFDPAFFELLFAHPNNIAEIFYKKITAALKDTDNHSPLYAVRIALHKNGFYQIVLLDLSGKIYIKHINLSEATIANKWHEKIFKDTAENILNITVKNIENEALPPAFDLTHINNAPLFHVVQSFTHYLTTQQKQPDSSFQAEFSLTDFSQYFPDIAAFDGLVENFYQRNSRLEQLHHKIQQMLAEVKHHSALTDVLIKRIAAMAKLAIVTEKLATKEVAMNALKQKIYDDVSTHYNSYLHAMDALKQIKTYLAWCMPLSLEQDRNQFVDNESLEKSAAYINKIIADLPQDQQITMINEINQAGETLTALHDFSPFTAWQKNIFLGKLYAGFNWSLPTKKLESQPEQEVLWVEQSLKNTFYHDYRHMEFSEEDNLLDDINMTLTTIQTSIPQYLKLFALQEKIKNYLAEKWLDTQHLSHQKTKILSLFKSLSLACDAHHITEISLDHCLYTFANDNLEKYLQEQTLAFQEKVAALKNLHASFLNITLLPENEDLREMTMRNLEKDLTEIETTYESLLKINNRFLSIEADIKMAQERYPLGHPQNIKKATATEDQSIDTCQMALQKAMLEIENQYAMPQLDKILALYPNDGALTRLATDHGIYIARIKTLHALYNDKQRMPRDALSHEAKNTHTELNQVLMHLASVDLALRDRVRFNIYVTKFKHELRSLEKMVQSLNIDKFKNHIEKYEASENLQQQLALFQENKKKFAQAQQKIANISFEPGELSQLVNIKEELNEAANHMKSSYQKIPTMKFENNIPSTDNTPKNFFKRHANQLWAASFVVGFAAVAALMVSGGLLPFALALASSLALSVPMAATFATIITASLGAGLGFALGAATCLSINSDSPPQKGFWQHHGKDVSIGTSIGVASSIAAVGLTILTLAAFGMGPLVVLSAIGKATAASLTAFGANITAAAGIGIAFSFFSVAIASISATVTAFVDVISDSKKPASPENPPSTPFITEVINPDIDSDTEKAFSPAVIKQGLKKPEPPVIGQKATPGAKPVQLSDEDLADLIYSFEDAPKVADSGFGFLDQPKNAPQPKNQNLPTPEFSMR